MIIIYSNILIYSNLYHTWYNLYMPYIFKLLSCIFNQTYLYKYLNIIFNVKEY